MDGMTLAHGSVEHEYGLRLSAKHADLLRASGVSVEVAREREYVTVDTKVALKKLGFGPSQQIDPALVVPIWSVTGERVGSQIRPDEPRYGNNGNSRNDPEKADLRWVINEGHRRGATVPGCVGANRDVIEEFPMYAPLALAGIGALPDTLASRSITIAMRRRTVAEPVEQFRQRQANEQLAPLRERIEAWAETIRPRLRGFVPVMPTGVEDRAADCWEPLLSIAELAGRVWTNEARAACVELVRVSREASASLAVRLLRDCKAVMNGAQEITTADLLMKLSLLDSAPWANLRGEPLDAIGLAKFLKPFKVEPHAVWVGTAPGHMQTLRGYSVGGDTGFYDAWLRYCPDPPDTSPDINPEQPVRPVRPARAQVSGLPSVDGGTSPDVV
jgi:Protein of unknown function (DUF3631)